MNSTNNKKIGNATEQKYLDLIKSKGGWASPIPATMLGQPVDTVAILGKQVFFADIKHCASDRFSFGAIQTNQETSMEMMTRAKNKDTYIPLPQTSHIKIGFWIWFEKQQEWKWLSFMVYKSCKVNGEKSIRFDDDKLGGWV